MIIFAILIVIAHINIFIRVNALLSVLWEPSLLTPMSIVKHVQPYVYHVLEIQRLVHHAMINITITTLAYQSALLTIMVLLIRLVNNAQQIHLNA